MTCPHCGAEAGTTSFCPKCSRLVRSPLLGMHRELAEARGKTYGAEAIAAAAASRAHDLAAMRSASSSAPASAKAPKTTAAAPPAPPPPVPAAPPSQLTATMRKALEKRERKARARAAATDYNDGSASAEERAQHFDSRHVGIDAPQDPAQIQAKPATKPEPVPERFARPGSLTMLALLHALVGLGLLGYASVLWRDGALVPLVRETLPHYLAGGVGLLFVLTALGLLGMRPFARAWLRLFAFIGLFLVPLGTVYSIILLAYLGSKGVALLFSHKSPKAMNTAELAAVRSTLKYSPVMATLFFVLSILPAIAVASFVRTALPAVLDLAWSAWPGAQASTTTAGPGGEVPTDPETRAEFDVQKLVVAQAAYASLGAGLYDRIECVTTPAACLGADGGKDVVLLGEEFKQAERNGYAYRLVMGRRPTPRPAGASATGVDAYAYVATPLSGEGAAFCGDSSGAVVRVDPTAVAGMKTPACPSQDPQ